MAVSWKGAVSFGLIYIPVSLYAATKEESIGFNMLHKKDLSRIHYKKFCDACGEEVKAEDIVKGYNYEADKYVVFDNDDFEHLKSPKDKNINIVQFVNESEIEPVFYDKAYYVVPDGGERAYALLLKAMSETRKVGIAKAVLGMKENLIAMRAMGDKLIMNTLFFVNEIKDIVTPYVKADVSDMEVTLAKELILHLSKPFKPDEFHDEYQEKLRLAIEQKINGKEIAVPKEKPQENIMNLMDALKASLKEHPGVRV